MASSMLLMFGIALVTFVIVTPVAAFVKGAREYDRRLVVDVISKATNDPNADEVVAEVERLRSQTPVGALIRQADNNIYGVLADMEYEGKIVERDGHLELVVQ